MKTSAAKDKVTINSIYQSVAKILFIAFELSSKGKWKLAFTIGSGQKPRIRDIDPGDIDALVTEIAKAKRRFKLPENCEVLSCFEAGRDGFWLHRYLESIGVKNLVVDSSSIEVKRRKRRAKTDRLDATKLVSMLIRWAGGEEKVWSIVQAPSEDAEDERQLERELADLKVEHTRLVNKIRGLLAIHGVKVKSINKDFTNWLRKVHRWNGKHLPESFGRRMLVIYDRLTFLRAQKAGIERERSRALKESETNSAKTARKLIALKAIGDNGAWVLSTEMFSWREFKNRKQVGSVAGLTGTPFQSGGDPREQGIDKAGNNRIRGMAVELAWCWVRHQPDSKLALWFQERWAEGGKRLRKIGIVALARKLLIALWRWVDQDIIPEGAILKK